MDRLDEWLAAARPDVARRLPDPLIEQHLLARMRERRALQSVAAAEASRTTCAARSSRRSAWFGVAAAMTSVALAALAFLVWIFSLAPVEHAQPPLAATPFFALAGADAIAAERSPVVVESRLPRVALADYGLPVDPARVDEAVGAELLLSRAGVVLAVRFKE